MAAFASLLLALRAIQYLRLPAGDISRVLGLQQPGAVGAAVSLGWCLEKVGQLVRVYRASKPAPPPDGEPDGTHGIVESMVLWCLGDDSRVSASDVPVLLSDVWAQGRLPVRVFLRVLTRVLAQVHVPEVRAALAHAVAGAVAGTPNPPVVDKGVYIPAAALTALKACGDSLTAAHVGLPWPPAALGRGPLPSPTSLPEVLLAATKHCLGAGTWRLSGRQVADDGPSCLPTDAYVAVELWCTHFCCQLLSLMIHSICWSLVWACGTAERWPGSSTLSQAGKARCHCSTRCLRLRAVITCLPAAFERLCLAPQ